MSITMTRGGGIYPNNNCLQVLFDPTGPTCAPNPVVVPAGTFGIVWIMGSSDGNTLYTTTQYKFLGVSIDSEIELWGYGPPPSVPSNSANRPEWSYPVFGSLGLNSENGAAFGPVSTMAVSDKHKDSSVSTNLHAYSILYMDNSSGTPVVKVFDPRIQNQ